VSASARFDRQAMLALVMDHAAPWGTVWQVRVMPPPIPARAP
jgi:hypothetical protein